MIKKHKKLPREFYNRDAHAVARDLLGKVMVRKTSEGVVKGRIMEVEVYKGTEESMDHACHAFPMKRTNRTEMMFGEAGHAYIYLIYGMYCCINIVCNEENVPECVLIRALEPMDGVELMRERRKQEKMTALCSGPGKLCQALALTREENGMDLCGEEFYVEEDEGHEDFEITASKRINIDYAKEAVDFTWRYTIKGSTFLSVKDKNAGTGRERRNGN